MIQLKGRITQKQSITGTIKNLSHVHGIISKPSYEHGKSDHVFVIVDLLKLYTANTEVINANAAMPLTATNTQGSDGYAVINLTSSTVTVNQAVAVVTDE